MGRIFPGYEGGLKPEFRFLNDKAVIIQAWKKAHEYIRAHNWYSDNLELDLSCIQLEELCGEIQALFSTNAWRDYRPAPMRVVPAPKAASKEWVITDASIAPPKDFGIRPLAHLSIKDQTIAVMFMCCLANLIETRQKSVSDYSADRVADSAVSYGNRLLCQWSVEEEDSDNEDEDVKCSAGANFLWANSITYDRYYQDYRRFLVRPDAVLKRLTADQMLQNRYYILSLDLSKCYDRINRKVLLSKIRREMVAASIFDDEFLEAMWRSFDWTWQSMDDPVLIDYAKRLDGRVAHESAWLGGQIGIPQGLVSGGFLANIYLLSLDDALRAMVDARAPIKISVGCDARIVDYCRYVDDLRLVVSVPRSSNMDGESVKRGIMNCLGPMISELAPGQKFNEDKAKIEEFCSGALGDSVVRQMAEITARASGPMDVQSAWEVILQSRSLWPKSQKNSGSIRVGEVEITQPIQRIKDDTIERYSANFWRREYRLLLDLLDGCDDEGEVLSLFNVSCSQKSLEALTDDFCNQIFRTWLADPSKVRILRIAFDLRPDVKKLRTVLRIVDRMIRSRRTAVKMTGRYILSELYRAAVVETGLSYAKEDDPRHHELIEYRHELSARADEFVARGVPWYAANQIALYKMVIEGCQKIPVGLGKCCDRVYEDCARGGFSRGISEGVLAYCLFNRQDQFTELNQLILKEYVEDRDCKVHQLMAFIGGDVLSSAGVHVNILPIRAVEIDNDRWINLRDLCFSEHNPFDSECAVLRLVSALVKLIGEINVTTDNYLALSSIEVRCSDWSNVLRAWMSVDLEARRSEVDINSDSDAFMFKPESWETGDFTRVAQVGRIVRAVIMQGDEYSEMRKSSLTIRAHERNSSGTCFKGIRSSWAKRRYGLYFDRVCLGGVHVAFSPWLTDLLSGMLCWPGSWCAKRFAQMAFADITEIVEDRLETLAEYEGSASGVSLIPVDINLRKFMNGDGDYKELHVAVIQNLLPQFDQLIKANGNLGNKEVRALRRHTSDLLQLLMQTFKTNRHALKLGNSINLVVMPELAIHERDIGLLERFADKMNCMVFSGVLFRSHPANPTKLINCGIWLIPQKKDARGRREFIKILQGKQNLTAPEKTIQNLVGYRPAQWIIRGMVNDEPQWNLSASICYDSTDIKLAADLRDHVDCYIVSAFNEDVGTFDAMTEAWRYHMFNHTIIANSGEFGGSTIQAPYSKPYQRTISHAHGSNQAVVSLAVLHLGKFENEYKPPYKASPTLPPSPKTSPAGYSGRKR